MVLVPAGVAILAVTAGDVHSAHDMHQRTCPTGRAWFDEAYANNAAHATGAECSNMGITMFTAATYSCCSLVRTLLKALK
eukprot:11606-Heterococcus_DN1.PRE.2